MAAIIVVVMSVFVLFIILGYFLLKDSGYLGFEKKNSKKESTSPESMMMEETTPTLSESDSTESLETELNSTTVGELESDIRDLQDDASSL